jgi:hypothetical protein
MGYDEARDRTVLFGGNSSGTLLNDTWLWDGTNWSAQSPSTRPPVRCAHAMAWDATSGRMILFGGSTSLDPTNSPALADTWAWDGTEWTALAPTMAPVGRASHTMTGDAARGTIVLFGGASPASPNLNLSDETWTWDGSGWTQQVPARRPAARASHGAAYDPMRKRVVIFGGGAYGFPSLSDSWEWDGTDWTQTTPTIRPPPTSQHAMAFGPGGVMVAGGLMSVVLSSLASSDLSTHSTWRYRVRGEACTAASDCDSRQCTDGVCCDSAACGECRQCNGTNPGVCTVITASNDATCVAPNVCGPTGLCGLPRGTACTSAGACATGFCVSSVCCDRACNGPCESCGSDGTCVTPSTCTAGKPVGTACSLGKECVSGFCVDGNCCNTACDGECDSCAAGVCAKSAADPHGTCKGENGCGGSCSSDGHCMFAPVGTGCDVCKACDGAGHCDQLPPNEDDDQCGSISCTALSTECVAYADVTMRRCVSVGLCAAANDPSSCTQSHLDADGTPCSMGVCSGGQCVSTPDLGSVGGKAGGCSFAGQKPSTGGPWTLGLVVLAAAIGRKWRFLNDPHHIRFRPLRRS